MSSEIKIRCRLDELMDSRNITSEKLAMASGVPEMRINQYRKGAMESVSMPEIAAIMAAMGCTNIGELLDVSTQTEAQGANPARAGLGFPLPGGCQQKAQMVQRHGRVGFPLPGICVPGMQAETGCDTVGVI